MTDIANILRHDIQPQCRIPDVENAPELHYDQEQPTRELLVRINRMRQDIAVTRSSADVTGY